VGVIRLPYCLRMVRGGVARRRSRFGLQPSQAKLWKLMDVNMRHTVRIWRDTKQRLNPPYFVSVIAQVDLDFAYVIRN